MFPLKIAYIKLAIIYIDGYENVLKWFQGCKKIVKLIKTADTWEYITVFDMNLG